MRARSAFQTSVPRALATWGRWRSFADLGPPARRSSGLAVVIAAVVIVAVVIVAAASAHAIRSLCCTLR